MIPSPFLEREATMSGLMGPTALPYYAGIVTAGMTPNDGTGDALTAPIDNPGLSGFDPGINQSGTVAKNAGAPLTASQLSDYKAKQAYNANPPQQPWYYDPSGGMGYPDSWIGTPMNMLSGGYTNPYGGTGGGNTSGLDSLTAQAVALAQKQGQVGAAQAGAQGQIGAAQFGMQGQIGAAQAAADAAKFAASQQVPVANINAGAQLGVAGLQKDVGMTQAADQLAAAMGVSANQLAGTKYGADQTLAGLKAQIANSIPLQNAVNAPAMAQVGLGQDKLALFKQLMGSGGVGGVGIGNNPGQSGAIAGGGDPMNPTASSNGAPPIPQSQVINPLLLQRSINQSQNQINKRYASIGNQMQQGLASRGFDTTGGLPPGIQEQLLQAESPELTNADLQWNLGAAGQNAQQSDTAAQLGLSQYNAQQDRLLRQQLANLGLLGGLIS